MDKRKSGRRISILKKQINEEATSTDTLTLKNKRKISFSGKKSVKEFCAGDNAETLWGSSYEESANSFTKPPEEPKIMNICEGYSFELFTDLCTSNASHNQEQWEIKQNKFMAQQKLAFNDKENSMYNSLTSKIPIPKVTLNDDNITMLALSNAGEKEEKNSDISELSTSSNSKNVTLYQSEIFGQKIFDLRRNSDEGSSITLNSTEFDNMILKRIKRKCKSPRKISKNSLEGSENINLSNFNIDMSLDQMNTTEGFMEIERIIAKSKISNKSIDEGFFPKILPDNLTKFGKSLIFEDTDIDGQTEEEPKLRRGTIFKVEDLDISSVESVPKSKIKVIPKNFPEDLDGKAEDERKLRRATMHKDEDVDTSLVESVPKSKIKIMAKSFPEDLDVSPLKAKQDEKPKESRRKTIQLDEVVDICTSNTKNQNSGKRSTLIFNNEQILNESCKYKHEIHKNIENNLSCINVDCSTFTSNDNKLHSKKRLTLVCNESIETETLHSNSEKVETVEFFPKQHKTHFDVDMEIDDLVGKSNDDLINQNMVYSEKLSEEQNKRKSRISLIKNDDMDETLIDTNIQISTNYKDDTQAVLNQLDCPSESFDGKLFSQCLTTKEDTFPFSESINTFVGYKSPHSNLKTITNEMTERASNTEHNQIEKNIERTTMYRATDISLENTEIPLSNLKEDNQKIKPITDRKTFCVPEDISINMTNPPSIFNKKSEFNIYSEKQTTNSRDWKQSNREISTRRTMCHNIDISIDEQTNYILKNDKRKTITNPAEISLELPSLEAASSNINNFQPFVPKNFTSKSDAENSKRKSIYENTKIDHDLITERICNSKFQETTVKGKVNQIITDEIEKQSEVMSFRKNLTNSSHSLHESQFKNLSQINSYNALLQRNRIEIEKQEIQEPESMKITNNSREKFENSQNNVDLQELLSTYENEMQKETSNSNTNRNIADDIAQTSINQIQERSAYNCGYALKNSKSKEFNVIDNFTEKSIKENIVPSSSIGNQRQTSVIKILKQVHKNTPPEGPPFKRNHMHHSNNDVGSLIKKNSIGKHLTRKTIIFENENNNLGKDELTANKILSTHNSKDKGIQSKNRQTIQFSSKLGDLDLTGITALENSVEITANEKPCKLLKEIPNINEIEKIEENFEKDSVVMDISIEMKETPTIDIFKNREIDYNQIENIDKDILELTSAIHNFDVSALDLNDIDEKLPEIVSDNSNVQFENYKNKRKTINFQQHKHLQNDMEISVNSDTLNVITNEPFQRIEIKSEVETEKLKNVGNNDLKISVSNTETFSTLTINRNIIQSPKGKINTTIYQSPIKEIIFKNSARKLDSTTQTSTGKDHLHISNLSNSFRRTLNFDEPLKPHTSSNIDSKQTPLPKPKEEMNDTDSPIVFYAVNENGSKNFLTNLNQSCYEEIAKTELNLVEISGENSVGQSNEESNSKKSKKIDEVEIIKNSSSVLFKSQFARRRSSSIKNCLRCKKCKISMDNTTIDNFKLETESVQMVDFSLLDKFKDLPTIRDVWIAHERRQAERYQLNYGNIKDENNANNFSLKDTDDILNTCLEELKGVNELCMKKIQIENCFPLSNKYESELKTKFPSINNIWKVKVCSLYDRNFILFTHVKCPTFELVIECSSLNFQNYDMKFSKIYTRPNCIYAEEAWSPSDKLMHMEIFKKLPSDHILLNNCSKLKNLNECLESFNQMVIETITNFRELMKVITISKASLEHYEDKVAIHKVYRYYSTEKYILKKLIIIKVNKINEISIRNMVSPKLSEFTTAAIKGFPIGIKFVELLLNNLTSYLA